MEEGSGNQEHCVQEDASEKRHEERTERVHQQVVFLAEGTRGGAEDASVAIKETADSPRPKCCGGPCQSGHDSLTWTVLSRRGEGADEGEEWG